MKNNWQSPPYILDRVKQVLGDDYFDPCPIDPDFDGLSIKWPNKNAFINPPYSRGSLESWVPKALKEYKEMWEDKEKDFVSFIWLVNYGATGNRILLKQEADAICDLYKRVNFVHPKTGIECKGNDRDSVIYYWGWRYGAFKTAFKDIGKVFIK